MPVEGLTFDSRGVFYKGLPFDKRQLSQEEVIRVSFALAIAAAPNLRNVLIRDGAMLDNKHRAIIAEMAEAAGVQVYMEVVGDHGAMIVFEDGKIR